MKRRRARENAIQILFQLEFTGENLTAQELKDLCQDKEKDVASFCTDIVSGTLKDIGHIDSLIKSSAEHWVIERMAVVDRNILRLATYELIRHKDTPPAVIINEAIEIAKKYSASESVPFINGILDNISKSLRGA